MELNEYMQKEDAFASILYNKCVNRYGDEFNEWESDTIHITLVDDFNAVDSSIDKVLSLVSLSNSMNGALCFFNEVNCFRHTINTLNNMDAHYEFMGGVLPEHISWGMHEVSMLYPEQKLFEEPAKFIGVCFHHVGGMVLPDELYEYQEFLDYYNKNTEVSKKIKEMWDKEKNISIDDLKEDDFIHMQFLILKANEEYLRYKKLMYKEDSENVK